MAIFVTESMGGGMITRSSQTDFAKTGQGPQTGEGLQIVSVPKMYDL